MGIMLPPLSVLLKDALREFPGAFPSIQSRDFPEAPCPNSAPFVRNSDFGKVKDQDVTLFPRRKAGQDQQGGKGPVVVSVELLQNFYGMPLHVAAKKLVICLSYTLSFVHICEMNSQRLFGE